MVLLVAVRSFLVILQPFARVLASFALLSTRVIGSPSSGMSNGVDLVSAFLQNVRGSCPPLGCMTVLGLRCDDEEVA